MATNPTTPVRRNSGTNSDGSFNILVEVARYVAPVLILLAAFFGFKKLLDMKAKPAESDQSEVKPLVRTAPIALNNDKLDISVSGAVRAIRHVDVFSEVAGKIESKSENCEAGLPIEAGDELFTIDTSDIVNDQDQIKLDVEQAKTALLKVDTDLASQQALLPITQRKLELRQAEVQRLNEISNIVSPSDMDLAALNEVSVRVELQTIKNQIASLQQSKAELAIAQKIAEKRLERANKDLERATVNAPIGGVIVTEHVQANAYVPKGANLVTIEDTSKVEVLVNLRLEELDWVLKQQRQLPDTTDRDRYVLPQTAATVILEVNGVPYSWEGVLVRYDGNGLDERNRTVPCVIEIGSPGNVTVNKKPVTHGPPALSPKMFVKVKIHVQPGKQLIRMPAESLQPNQTVRVFRDGKVAIVGVAVAVRDGNQVLVEPVDGDLRSTDLAIISPLAAARDGMEVREAGDAVTTDDESTGENDEGETEPEEV